MELKWLQSFATVYELGNFRLAAEKLFISQPSISVHIKLLEENLMTPLFERHHTQLQLTAEGKYFYPLAKEILEKVQESKNLLSDFSYQQKVQLSVALSPLLVETKLPKILYEFMLQHANYAIEIVVEDSQKIDQLIHLQQVHLGIDIGKKKSKDIHAEQLHSSPIALIYPSTFQTTATSSTAIVDELLQQYPMFDGYMDELPVVLAYMEKEHRFMQKNTIHQSNIVKQLIVDGLGIGYLPKIQVEDDVRSGHLQSIDLPYTQFYSVEIYMKHIRASEQLLPLLKFIRGKYTGG